MAGKNKLKIKFLIIGVFALSFALGGCATSFDSHGRYHIVQRGETLESIARGYRLNLQEMAELNSIENSKKVSVGKKIYLPERHYKHPRFKKLPIDEVISKQMKKSPSRPSQEKRSSKTVYTEHGRFLWPVNGYVMSGFGMRKGTHHDGIDVKVKVGTPIKAADSGVVAFSGKMRGYGNIIVLQHKDNFFTAYAHNSRNEVKEGQRVKPGEVIGKVGLTGRTTGPHLHFEVRHGTKPRNPLFFLPTIR